MTDEQTRKNRAKAYLGASGAIALGAAAPKNVLGYNTVYHGTSSSNAEKIRSEGLKRSKAGTASGGADINAGHATKADIKGRVFTTTNKEYAARYRPNLFGRYSGEVVKMHTPYRGSSRRPKDAIIDAAVKGKISGMTPEERSRFKRIQRGTHVFKHDIKTRFIEGSKNFGGRRQFLNAHHLRRYLAAEGGKARFAKGLGQLGAAAALAAYAGHKLTKKAGHEGVLAATCVGSQAVPEVMKTLARREGGEALSSLRKVAPKALAAGDGVALAAKAYQHLNRSRNG